MKNNTQELIQKLNTCLWQLGWTWTHPRIKAYLGIVSQKLKTAEFQSLVDVPEGYLSRLIKLVDLYYQCDKLLKLMKRTWQDPEIQQIINSYGYDGDSMPLEGYEALHKFLDDFWYDNYGF